jgi:hypothetical protein
MNLKNLYRDPAIFSLYHERKAIELANIINKYHKQPTFGQIAELLSHAAMAERYRNEAVAIFLRFKVKPRKMKLNNFLNKHTHD